MTQQPSQGSEPVSVSQVPGDLDALAAAKPEEVSPGVVERMNDLPAAAPSEGSGVSGNLNEIQVQPPPLPQSAPPAAHP